MNIKEFRIIDLFCGCGGLSLGFQNAGFNVVAAYDVWQVALNIYNKNFTHHAYFRDLSDVSDLSDLAEYAPNFIIGGPPCQDYSTAGHRDENRGRAALSVSFANIVDGLRPKFFLMENVAAFAKSKTFNAVCKIFKDANYGLTQMVLDASLCGVPQKRLRYITFGELYGQDNAVREIFSRRESKKSMTMRDYFGDSLGFEHYFRVPTNYTRRGIYSIDEPSMTIRGVDRPVPKGYKGHPADSAPLSPDIRSLTYQERSWIQTFPKDFVWEGSKTNINQAIGNAVPVKLAEFIANCIKEYIYEQATR